tara:strand:+ start:173 stop:886 length:714 start_codon:yes stop_codon:yes gene_type:complete
MKNIYYWLIGILLIFAIIGSFIPDEANEGREVSIGTYDNDIESGGILDVEPSEITPPPTSKIKVTRVIDGDTIEIEGGERVRLICMDTPERGEEGYIDASNYLQALILNKYVRLEKDKSDTDRYGRLLRYIYVDDLFVNEKMVEEGFAKAYPYNPDVTLCPQIEEAEEKAKNREKGIWSDVREEVEVIGDCSGNVYNCGDFLTHTEAQAVFEKCGGVSNDVHELDSDEDGIACESLP